MITYIKIHCKAISYCLLQSAVNTDRNTSCSQNYVHVIHENSGLSYN